MKKICRDFLLRLTVLSAFDILSLGFYTNEILKLHTLLFESGTSVFSFY